MKSGEGICGEEDSAEGVAIGQRTITTERANCVKGADSYHMPPWGREGAGCTVSLSFLKVVN